MYKLKVYHGNEIKKLLFPISDSYLLSSDFSESETEDRAANTLKNEKGTYNKGLFVHGQIIQRL